MEKHSLIFGGIAKKISLEYFLIILVLVNYVY